MRLNIHKGFTLAELMITFTAIGILIAVLVPVLFMAAPDTNKLKAKKAYNTLTRAMQILMNSDPYVNTASLDASKIITGDTQEDEILRNTLFCSALADTLNANNVNCGGEDDKRDAADAVNMVIHNHQISNCNGPNFIIQDEYPSSDKPRWVRCVLPANSDGTAQAGNAKDIIDNGAIAHSLLYDHGDWFDKDSDNRGLEQSLDRACNYYFAAAHTEAPHNPPIYNFKTTDGVRWGVQLLNFAHKWVINYNNVKIPALHGVICIDTGNDSDEYTQADINKNVDYPKGYAVGVRADGRLHPGTKLKQLLDEDLQDI